MQAKLGLLALLSLLSSAAHGFVEFEYYAGHKCNNTRLSAVELRPKTGCVKLDSAAKSFHIGGPASQRQVQAGCKVNGWFGTRCRGSLYLQIVGPSDGRTCYVTGETDGTVAVVNSVEMICKAS